MPQKLHFRPANESDLVRVAALVNSAYRGEVSRQGWTTEAHLLGGQRTDVGRLSETLAPDALGNPQRIEIGFLPEDTQKPVACMHLRHEKPGAHMHLRHEKPATAYVGMLTVDPALQGAGCGKQLLDRAEEIGREWGCIRMRMTVIHLREELLAYYIRRGYALTGVSEPFPTDDPRFGAPKVAGMKLLELAKAIQRSS